MDSIIVIIPNNKMPVTADWTYWHTECKICDTSHYTLTIEDTQKHAAEYHPDSTLNLSHKST